MGTECSYCGKLKAVTSYNGKPSCIFCPPKLTPEEIADLATRHQPGTNCHVSGCSLAAVVTVLGQDWCAAHKDAADFCQFVFEHHKWLDLAARINQLEAKHTTSIPPNSAKVIKISVKGDSNA